MPRWSLTLLLVAAAAAVPWLGSTRLPTLARPTLDAYQDETQAGCLLVRTSLEREAVAPGEGLYAVVTVTSDPSCSARRRPVDLALVMDVSGSMAAEGKLGEAQRAATELLDRLGPDDRVALVTFSDDTSVVAPLGSAHERIRAAVAGLYPDGATFLSGGLDAGLAALPGRPDRVERVLLMTDGQANRGVTSPDALARSVRRATASVSTIGLGAAYNEELLATLADAGRGAYHYAEAGSDLAGLYARELDRAATLSLRDAQVVLRPAPGWDIARVYGWSAERGDGALISVGDLAAGEERSVVIRLQPLSMDAAPGLDAEVRALPAQGDTVVYAPTYVRAALDADLAATARPLPEVALAVAQALAGDGVEEARQAWRRGDEGAARQAIAEARRSLEAVEAMAPAARQSIGELDHVAAAPSPDVAIMRASEASRDLAR